MSRLPRLQRIDRPQRHLISLGVYANERSFILLSTSRHQEPILRRSRVRPSGEPADAFTRKLRKELVGAEFGAIHTAGLDWSSESWARLDLRRGQQEFAIVCERRSPRSESFILLGSDDRIVHASNLAPLKARGLRVGDRYIPASPAATAPRMLSDLPIVEDAEGTENSATTDAARALDRALRQAEKRLQRKLTAIDGDLRRAEGAPELRKQASLLLAKLHELEPNQRRVELNDWDHPKQPPVVLQWPPPHTPAQMVERLFHRARRYERGAEIAKERYSTCAKELERIARWRSTLEHGNDELDAHELETIVAQSKTLLGRHGLKTERKKRDDKPAPRSPFRLFETREGRIAVGRSAADNDELTLRHARPHDLWLHARGQRGAHVVVPLAGRRATCPQRLLLDAAMLAAHFSAARDEKIVEIVCAKRSHVQKRRAAAPGSVQVLQEKVILVRPEHERLRHLLDREIDASTGLRM